MVLIPNYCTKTHSLYPYIPGTCTFLVIQEEKYSRLPFVRVVLPLLCRKSRALAISCTTTLASCSLKWRLLWICAKIEPSRGRNKIKSNQFTRANHGMHTDTNNRPHTTDCAHALEKCLKIYKMIWCRHPAAAPTHLPPLSFSNTR